MLAKTISAAQYVFGNLTKEQSPTRRSGYQTLFYTRERLTSADVREIEDRVQYGTGQLGRAKWQFYWLSSEQAVITHCVAVPEPDEFGRKGRFLAHSLILRRRQWTLLKCNPFGLMRAENFSPTMDHALTLGDLKSSELSAASVENSTLPIEQARNVASQWDPDELWKLARLVCHPDEAGQFVAFIGDDRQTCDVLTLAFLLQPSPRMDCSFDTSSTGCRWPKDVTFWARGFSDGREARTPFVVDVAQKKIKLPREWHPPATPYENWLKPALFKRDFSWIGTDEGLAKSRSLAIHSRSVSRPVRSVAPDIAPRCASHPVRRSVLLLLCVLPFVFIGGDSLQASRPVRSQFLANTFAEVDREQADWFDAQSFRECRRVTGCALERY